MLQGNDKFLLRLGPISGAINTEACCCIHRWHVGRFIRICLPASRETGPPGTLRIKREARCIASWLRFFLLRPIRI